MASIDDATKAEWDALNKDSQDMATLHDDYEFTFDETDPYYTPEEWAQVIKAAPKGTKPAPKQDIAAYRKGIPVFSGVLNYFPDAIRAVAICSRIGNDQHNPDKPLFWDRSKSGDELDALTRHLIEAGTVDTDGIRHSAKVAWRALANLQKELEKAGETS